MGNQLTIKGGGISQAAVQSLIDAYAAPLVHASRHQDAGADELDLTGLAGNVNYVNRGDPAAYDFTIANFGTIASFTNLDCSAIVPDGAKMIHFLFLFHHPTQAGAYFQFRKDGNSNTFNIAFPYIAPANIITSFDCFVLCSSSRIIEYLNSHAGASTASLSIRGWFI